MFNHLELDLPSLERVTIDGVRYYSIPNKEELKRYVSITSVISHFNKEKFIGWRKKVGEEEANRITKRATERGTDAHTLIEHHLLNRELPTNILPLSKHLFNYSKKELNKINNIYGLECPLYSDYLGIAGTCDCIAEYNNELAIIDFKTSKEPKPRNWIDGYFVQCAAYACMLHELTDLTVKKFVIIMTCENGECVVYEEYDKAKYIKLLTKYIHKFVSDKLELIAS